MGAGIGDRPLVRGHDRRAAPLALVDKPEVFFLGGAKVVKGLVEVSDPLSLDTYHPVSVGIHEPHAGVHLGDEESLHLGVAADAAPTFVQAAYEKGVFCLWSFTVER